MGGIIQLLIALLTLVNTFYQYRTEQEVRKLNEENRKERRNGKPHN